MAQLLTLPAQQLLPGTSVAQTTFTGPQQLPIGTSTTQFPTIAGNQLQPGALVDIFAHGVFSNTGTPTLVLGVYYGGTGTALAVSAAITTTTGATAWPWELQYRGRVVANGSSGSIIGRGSMKLGTALTTFTAENFMPVTSPAAVTIDTTVAKTLAVGATWSVSSASNSITCHYMHALIHG